MAWRSKVVWSEGMFLRPQHFQQQDRYWEATLQGRCESLRPYSWGITELVLNPGALKMGRVALERCAGILPDGTPFAMPERDPLPPPVEIDPAWRDVVIHLALPLAAPEAIDVDRGERPESVARFRVADHTVRDTVAGPGSREPVEIEVGERRFQLLSDRAPLGEYAVAGIARVRERRADNVVDLDKEYIPPCLNCRLDEVLRSYVGELQGLIQQRANTLGGRAGAPGSTRINEAGNLLMLQVLNRTDPLFNHLAQMDGLHPQSLYAIMLQLAGELATFTQQRRRPPSFPPYRHEDLQSCFPPVMAELRRSFEFMLPKGVIRLPLAKHGSTYVSRFEQWEENDLLDTAMFVMIVRARMGTEELRNNLPNLLKICAVEKIKSIVGAATRGVPVTAMPQAPPQLEYHENRVYFELERFNREGEYNDFWEELKNSLALALHIGRPEDFPALDIQLWAIRLKNRQED